MVAFFVELIAEGCFRQIHLKDTGSEIHRTAFEPCKRQYGAMLRRHGLVFLSHSTFVSDEIGICAAQSGRTHGFMGIHHNMLVGSLFDRIQVMAHLLLAIMMLSTGNDISYISALDDIVAIFFSSDRKPCPCAGRNYPQPLMSRDAS